MKVRTLIILMIIKESNKAHTFLQVRINGTIDTMNNNHIRGVLGITLKEKTQGTDNLSHHLENTLNHSQ